MFDEFAQLFASTGFMPHGHCYLWRPGIVWLHAGSDALVALSYTTIPFALAYFVRKRSDLPFTWMFRLFGLFIIACGATHYMAIWTLWDPVYRLSGAIKLVTAMASVPTAILLVKLMPQALALPSPRQLRAANEDLKAAKLELQATNRQLAATNAELEAFSYSVAHDLRAPLRAMSGFSNVLRQTAEGKLDEEEKDCLQEITQNAEGMAALIDGLLALSRVTRYELTKRSVDVTRTAAHVLDALAASDPSRSVRVVVQPGMQANADPQLLRSLLENLLGNAWKFTRDADAAAIEVGVCEQEGDDVFYVKDNGAGFDPEYAARLFTAFQRFHTQAEFTGTGIGLATARRIVTRHGGRVWAEGRVGEGATFYFTLAEPTQQREAEP